MHTFWHAIPASNYIFILVLYHTFTHITWYLPLFSAFPDCFSSKSGGPCCLLPRDESVFLLEWWCWRTGDRWRTGECDFLQNKKQHLKCNVNMYYVYTIWCLRNVPKTQTLYRIQKTVVGRCNNNCKQQSKDVKLHPIGCKNAWNAGPIRWKEHLPVYARKQTNGPPDAAQGFSTASCNSRHALSPRRVITPTPSPCLLVQNLYSKRIVTTDNMWPNFNDDISS